MNTFFYVHDLYKSAVLTVDNKHILYVDHLYIGSAQRWITEIASKYRNDIRLTACHMSLQLQVTSLIFQSSKSWNQRYEKSDKREQKNTPSLLVFGTEDYNFPLQFQTRAKEHANFICIRH